MNKYIKRNIIFLIASMVINIADAAEIPTGYNTPIPESILTPDRVDTRLGTLEFFDGVPTEKTAEKVFEHLAFLRGVEVFLNGLPMASVEALRQGFISIGVTEAHHMIVTDQLMDSTPLFLTANTDTVYAFSSFDLEKTGSLVIEVPPGTGPGTVNDAFSGSLSTWARSVPTAGKEESI